MPLRLLSLPLALAALVLTLALPAAALADTYTYTYNGSASPFTYVGSLNESDPFTTSDYVTFTLTLPTALNQNGSNIFDGSIPGGASFSLSVLDGQGNVIEQLTNTTSGVDPYFSLTTTGGQITSWNVTASTGNNPPGTPYYEIQLTDFETYVDYDDYETSGCLGSCVNDHYADAGNSNPVDNWTVPSINNGVPPPATTPEPTSLVLAGTGLFGLAAFTRRRRLLKPAAALAIAAAAALIPSTARADTTYDYTGSAFTTLTTSGGASQVYSTGDSITGSVTFASAPDNLTFATFTPVEAFSFSDGVQTISNTTPGLDTTFFQFQTNASGAITAWAIDVYTGPNGAQDEIRINSNTGDFGIDHTAGASAYAEGSTTVAGSFSPAATVATPEPTSLILAGSGLLGLAAFTRRRLSPGCPTSRF